jgi:amidase
MLSVCARRRVACHGDNGWQPFSVWGPMARTVADVALLLSAIAGLRPRSPISIPTIQHDFARLWDRTFKGVRVAWWKGLGGIPFEPEVRAVVDANRRVFETLGCVTEEAEPDFAGVAEAFPVLRYAASYAQNAALVRQRAEWVKDTIKYEVAEAERLTAADMARHRAPDADVRAKPQFFERLRFLRVAGHAGRAVRSERSVPDRNRRHRDGSYIDWMRSCWYITFMSNPAISVPAGFTATGLPVGIQIVGRHRDEWSVLQLAHAFEQATTHGNRRP